MDKLKLCSKCKKQKRGQSKRYCDKCHSEYMKEWRKLHPLNEKQKLKERARAYARVYVKRGKIEKEPCFKCGSLKSQIHHPDYCKPTMIIWLCREHHLDIHKK